MATVTNNEKFLLGVSSDDFRGININDPIAYNGNAKYYDPWLFYAFQGAKKGRWNEMENRYKNEDEYDDMYLRIGDKYIRINPNFVTAGSGKKWGTYRYMDENNLEKSVTLSPDNIFYRFNPNIGAASTPTTPSTPSTPAPTGGYLHLNDKTAPVITPNYGAYTYSEWMGDTNPWGATNFNDIRNLGNIYGDIDTEDELNIFANLYGAQNAIDYINSHSGGNPLFVGKKFSGNADDVKRAAALLGQYAATAEGKPFYEQLRRGYASLDNMDKYEAYAATKGWTGDGGADRNYLNEARNSVDGRYNGARFFMDYAGDKTWGTLANEFARNNRFREDYTVNGKHVMDRLNRDAGLGDGRTLIQIYNDIISKNPDLTNDDERKYRIFRDMTRRRFKLDNNFWNRYGLLPWARDNVYGTGNIRFKDGGQIFRMLFV